MKHIVNQDRDQIFEFYGNEILHTEISVDIDAFYGINLMMNNNILGTFDSPQGAVEQISKIFSSDGEIVVIDGYSRGGLEGC